jgi:hypothetical protein
VLCGSAFEDGVERFEIKLDKSKPVFKASTAFAQFQDSIPAADKKALFALPKKSDKKTKEKVS